MIEVSHLVKRYGSNAAVDDLSFTVEKGQIYGFLGPNGAGKSTTMNILTGYTAPTSGDILINGHNILEEPQEARRCIGYLPEIPPVYPEMTVMEYLDFAAGLKRLPRRERSGLIGKVMEQTGIGEVRYRLIRNLSKGYRQRVGLAQAILGSPEIIILDEPMVGLDPKQIIEIRELIRSLAGNHTVILSSHILSEISAVCDHIMIIAHGKLAASDTPENLTNLMKGSGALELTVRGSEAKVRQLFGSVNGITGFSAAASADQGAWDVTMRTEADRDLRERIFYLCAENKLAILRMQQTHASLEDVFLELTEAEREDALPGAEAAKHGEMSGADPAENPAEQMSGADLAENPAEQMSGDSERRAEQMSGDSERRAEQMSGGSERCAEQMSGDSERRAEQMSGGSGGRTEYKSAESAGGRAQRSKEVRRGQEGGIL